MRVLEHRGISPVISVILLVILVIGLSAGATYFVSDFGESDSSIGVSPVEIVKKGPETVQIRYLQTVESEEVIIRYDEGLQRTLKNPGQTITIRAFEEIQVLERSKQGGTNLLMRQELPKGRTPTKYIHDNESLQDAIDNSTNGDVIVVRNGTYNETTVNKNVTIIGTNNATVSGQQSCAYGYTCVLYADASNSVIEGLVLDGNHTTEVGILADGDNVTIKDATATRLRIYGFMFYSPLFQVENGELINSHASETAGDGVYSNSHNLEIRYGSYNGDSAAIILANGTYTSKDTIIEKLTMNTTAKNGIVSQERVDNITVHQVEIQNPKYTGISIENGKNIRVTDTKIENITRGIHINRSRNIYIEDNVINGSADFNETTLAIDGFNISGHGIRVDGKNAQVIDNRVTRTTNYAIFTSANNSVVSENFVHRAYGGIMENRWPYTLDKTSLQNENVTIERNIAYKIQGWGIYTTYIKRHGKITQNYVFDTGSYGFAISSARDAEESTINYTYNTIRRTGWSCVSMSEGRASFQFTNNRLEICGYNNNAVFGGIGAAYANSGIHFNAEPEQIGAPDTVIQENHFGNVSRYNIFVQGALNDTTDGTYEPPVDPSNNYYEMLGESCPKCSYFAKNVGEDITPGPFRENPPIAGSDLRYGENETE